MLLRPKSRAGALCENLAINVDDSDHRFYYKCGKSSSCREVSSVSGVECARCGGRLDVPIVAVEVEKGSNLRGVFVKEGKYMVTDDMKVRAVSISESLGLLREFGIEDMSILEKKDVLVGEQVILNLLKRSLVSNKPLTDVFLHESNITLVEEIPRPTKITRSRLKPNKATSDFKQINIKLHISTDTDRVIYAETGEDFVDLVFSFLTFPLGSVIKLLENHSFLGCIDNLYESIQVLSNSDFGYLKSDNCKNMLLDPKLPPYYGCRHQFLSISEVPAGIIRTCACNKCEFPKGSSNRCIHGMYFGTYSEINPKRKNYFGNGKGYAKEMVKYMVTDEMQVTPLSPISGCHIIKKLMVPISSLEEAEAGVGEAEALNLLMACLLSPTALTDVFFPHPLMLFQQNWFGKLPRKYVSDEE